ncbi:DUF6602 domain-containing protein [uncultured Brevundimonas sp.]|uniref:DUF6602 domain-containing protein n=1 Tax=uncultured Brevundimonas sp. TaxID=213418 RepID=UPI0025F50658|nr:DUF6602 domain-containing protein [uncultured Brevundimonas sp.]
MTLLKARLERISANMKEAYRDSASYVSPVTGREREVFVHAFLEKILPPSMRVGAGVITDARGVTTGQLDVVVELPLSVSFPIVGENRHYVADTVGAVIEVKSDLTKQWSEVKAKAADLLRLGRFSPGPDEVFSSHDYRVPLFVVAFKGPKTRKTLESYLSQMRRGDWPAVVYVVESDLLISQGPSGWLTARSPAACTFGFVSALYEHLQRRRDAPVVFDRYVTNLFPAASQE